MPTDRTLRRWFLPTCALALAALLAGCETLEMQQRKWIFMPSHGLSWSETQAQGMDDVWIEHESRESGTRVKLHTKTSDQATFRRLV